MSLPSALQLIQATMLEHNDQIHAVQTGQLLDKLHRNKLVIAMCGHFSAGKSSLINAMCGTQVLASGPIPTSANLVMIENQEIGIPKALVQYRGTNNHDQLPQQSVTLDEIENLSKNGLEVERIDIQLPVPLLADQLILMDTPGVDSTDDAHRLATESALHLADVVFYVTDYNHVQSEVNFNFTKRLKDWGKTLYIIVNQVDKHNDNELSFDRFTADVKNAFTDWGIHADGYLFISVKQPGHPRSEWYKLMELFEQLKNDYHTFLEASVVLSGIHLVKEHVTSIYPEEMLPDVDGLTLEQVTEQLHQLEMSMEQLNEKPMLLKQQFRDELTRLVNNANIMPAAARDKAAVYLQSRKPGFRVGLLFSESKTKQEASERLRTFTEMVQDYTDKQLVWHMNHMIKTYSESAETSALLLKHHIQLPEIQTFVTAEWIDGLVNTASGFTDEYTMIFTQQLTEQIKTNYRKQATDLFEYIVRAYNEENKQSIASIEASKDKLNIELNQFAALKEQESKKDGYQAALLTQIERFNNQTILYPNPDRMDNNKLTQHNAEYSSPQAPAGINPDLSLSSEDHSSQEHEDHNDNVNPFQYRTVMSLMANRLSQAAELIEPIPSLSSIRLSLNERVAKLQNHQFTIALFGAFSAGKSSFANALMGQSILPVSPNPTTAAINRIVPAYEQGPHLTARIRMKSVESILADIRYSFNMLGIDQTIETLEAAVKVIRSIHNQRITSRGKAHLSFLQAIEHGWQDIQGRLGQEWLAEEYEYRQYVANESKSCFVDRIDLHYSSEFTDQGVILVDTPGADSIHARHTGVAFDYIKNADAIFFVTYYNHAFSQADKQFLLQLGRVKDSFEMDKMFFIINAADLANSQEELNDVIEHVRNQLQQHGILNPRIYPVSSRLAIEARLAQRMDALERSGMLAFERSFASFAVKELAGVALRSAELELDKAVQAVRLGIEQSRLSAEQVERNMEHRRSLLPVVEVELRSQLSQFVTTSIHQELNELLHYVKQRCSFRFGEWFNDAFHPSVLQEDGRNMNVALNSAWKQLVQSASIEASQEVLATSLRMDNYVRKSLNSLRDQLLQIIRERMEQFISEASLTDIFGTPEVKESITEPAIDHKLFRKYFKNAKAFFEGDGKTQLKNELQAIIDVAISSYVNEHEQKLNLYYDQLFVEEAERIGTQLIEELNHFCNGVMFNDHSDIDLNDLESKLIRIQH